MSTRVHQALAASTNIVFPGVYDTLSAKMAERVGFQLAFVSGYAVSATLIGEPDFGLLTQSEVIDRARHICRSVSMPVIVDADTGYGNPLNVIRTVQELIDAGAAGCFLEDQQWPKRCGHMRGKKVIPKDEYLNKIHAAVDARQDADFLSLHGQTRSLRSALTPPLNEPKPQKPSAQTQHLSKHLAPWMSSQKSVAERRNRPLQT